MAGLDQHPYSQVAVSATETSQFSSLKEEQLGSEIAQRAVQLPISVVAVSLKKESAVKLQIEAIRLALHEHHIVHEIIVVDDGSNDRTAEEATQAHARVLQHPANRGYGAALKTGIRAALHDTIVIIDADGTYPATAIPELLVRAGEYDMVVGARTAANAKIPLVRKPAKWLLRTLAGYLAGQSIPDLNSGLRVMQRTIIERFEHILPAGFSFTTTITLAHLCNDYLVYYCPIEYHQRIGRSKIRPVDAYHFLLLILRTIVYFNPLKVFLPMGMILFLIGLGKFIYDLFLGNLSETALLGFLGAFIIWAMGLLSDQLAKVGFAIHSK
jgi:glycosyltransferase involved in cell wall biosynthesis